MVAQTFTEVLELAKEEDGLTYDDIQEELMRDARAGLSQGRASRRHSKVSL